MVSDGDAHTRVVATAAALEAIHRLRAVRGPLMFIQSGGCCDGSMPMCLEAGDLVVGDNDTLLGEIGGCPFYIDAALDRALKCPQFLLDVQAGAPEGFSLPAGPDAHFVTVTAECAMPSWAPGPSRRPLDRS